jgi:transposase InsO family protein
MEVRKKKKRIDKVLRKIYYDPEHAGSFGGINALKRVVGKQVSTSDIEYWLQSQDTYTLHKPVRHHFKRRRIIVSDIDEQWEADLVDLSGISKYNKHFRYLLTVIDTLSKFAWIVPLKTKTGKEIVDAFTKIFSISKRKPQNLRSDKGMEFLNKMFQLFLKKENIHFFTSNNEVKASIVERFNRTLKTKMWKYFTEKNTLSYLPVLKELLQSYNNTWHRSIKRKPSSVNEVNASEVWHTLYAREKLLDKDVKKFRE